MSRAGGGATSRSPRGSILHILSPLEMVWSGTALSSTSHSPPPGAGSGSLRRAPSPRRGRRGWHWAPRDSVVNRLVGEWLREHGWYGY